ncbi:putative glycosyltransferase EpsF [bioreactor metagenome]|uniref:Putative glycosyltransferase EpsF n=1 Tax=bioreactor metagenome TaxID=1076179 RepID=A0A645IXY1_9ZZZZ
MLLLVGEGELLEQTRKKAEVMGISDHVIFTGFRTDVDRLLQAFDLFLMPSVNEGLPTVIVEAQATGVSCVLSDTVTQECKILDDTAFLALKAPVGEWACKMDSILSQHIRQDTSKLLVEQGFDVKETVKWLCGYYESRVNQ